MLPKIILRDLNPSVVAAWSRFCADLDFVSVEQGSILDTECDAIVSPANSFGFMDGGVDLVYLNYFGMGIQARVQQMIPERHGGELLVGTADIVDTGHTRIPYLIAAPTMRVPMILYDSVNAHLAMRAVLLLVLRGQFAEGSHAGEPISNYVRSIAVPGLCTGVGRMGPNTSAHQTRAAIDDVALGKYNFPRSWVEASDRHQKLYTTRLKRLQEE